LILSRPAANLENEKSALAQQALDGKSLVEKVKKQRATNGRGREEKKKEPGSKVGGTEDNTSKTATINARPIRICAEQIINNYMITACCK
jgi:hypothetical protein